MKLQITKCVLRIMYCFWCVYGKKHNQFFTDGECKTLKKLRLKSDLHILLVRVQVVTCKDSYLRTT